jgi:hypothetical protein
MSCKNLQGHMKASWHAVSEGSKNARGRRMRVRVHEGAHAIAIRWTSRRPVYTAPFLRLNHTEVYYIIFFLSLFLPFVLIKC